MKADLIDIGFTRDGATKLTIQTTENVTDLFDSLKDFPVTVEIKKFHPKRSLDANAYAWVLMDKLAEKLAIPKIDIYREAIRNVGGNSETVCVREKAADKLISGWSHNGIGWITDVMPSKIEGCKNVILYYGSSTFDTAQMSRLIDGLVQDCSNNGIETKPPEEIKSLLEAWDGR